MRSLYSIYLCQFESIRSGLFVIKRQFQGYFLVVKLKSWLWKLYGRRHDLVNGHWMSMSKMTTVMFLCRDHNRVITSSFVTSHRIYYTPSRMDATGRAKTAYLSGNLSSIRVFSWALYWGKKSKLKKKKKQQRKKKKKLQKQNVAFISGNWVFIV